MKKGIIKFTSLFTVVLMCMTMIPSAIFAEGEHVHSMEYVEKVEATCQKSGMEAHYYCSGCDGLFADKDGQTPVEGDDLIIPIKDHDWDDGVIERQATPEEPGIITYTCKVCGTKNSEDIEYVEPPVDVTTAKKFSLDGNKLQFKNAVTKKPQNFVAKAKVDHVWVKAAKQKVTVNWKVNNGMKIADGIIVLRKTGSEKVYKEIGKVSLKKNVSGVLKWDPKSYYVDKTAKKKNTSYTYIAVAYVDEDDIIYITHCSDWAAAQTSASKLKNVYTAKMSKKSLSMQYKGTAALKVNISKPKTVFMANTIRWYSDNTKAAKVSSKGKVTAAKPGSTTIRARLASGNDVTCKVSVVGAFTPETPKIKVDVASNDSITLTWNKTKNATSYDLYRSDDGVHWKKPSEKQRTLKIKGTSRKVTGLKKGQRYAFYVVARNDNHGYTATSRNSNVVYQKAVIKRRPSALTGWPVSKKLTAGQSLILSLAATSPDGRKANLQKLVGKKWVTQKTVTLPKGAGKVSFKLLFPNSWWGLTTSWRLVIPRNNTSEECVSKTLVIQSVRVYQNPAKYVQIKDTIDKHGYSYYTSKVLVNSTSNRTNHVEALITTANKYLGDPYLSGKSGAPKKGIDAPGLVMQACYGAGVDLWPISPSTRPVDCVEEIFEKSKLEHIDNYDYNPDSTDFKNVYRGDLVFFYTGKNHVGHVAVYLGLGKVLHASQVSGKVETTTLKKLVSKNGKYKYRIAGVRRIFAFV